MATTILKTNERVDRKCVKGEEPQGFQELQDKAYSLDSFKDYITDYSLSGITDTIFYKRGFQALKANYHYSYDKSLEDFYYDDLYLLYQESFLPLEVLLKLYQYNLKAFRYRVGYIPREKLNIYIFPLITSKDFPVGKVTFFLDQNDNYTYCRQIKSLADIIIDREGA